MAKLALKKASTDVTVYLFAQDSSKTTGEGLTGLAYNTSNLVASYVRPLGSRAAITLATQTVTGAHTDGGFVEIDATNMPGLYRLDLPDAVCATGVPSAIVMLKGATNLAPVLLEIQLTDFDLNTAGVTLATSQPAITWGQQKIVADVDGQGALVIQNTHDKGFGKLTFGGLVGEYNYGMAMAGVRNQSDDGIGTLNDGYTFGVRNAGISGGMYNKATGVGSAAMFNDAQGTDGIGLKNVGEAQNVEGFDPAIATATKLQTVDDIVDTIKTKTDNLPATPASAGEYTAAIAAIPTAPLLAANYTAPDNASIATIKAKTNLIPANPAVADEYDAALAAIQADLDNPNQYKADVSGIPAAVWGYATRTLSSFGSLIADIWSHVTRTLSSFGFTVATNSDANVTAIKAKTDNLSATPASAGEYTSALTAIQNDLDNPDQYKADVSALATQESVNAIPTTPLLAANYTAPDNAGIGAIKTKTDQLVFTTPNKVDASAVIDPTGIATSEELEVIGEKVDNVLDKLNVSSVEFVTSVVGSTITILRGDTLTASLLNLGSMESYVSLDFTVKRNTSNTDDEAVIRIRKNASGLTDGLLRLNGAAHTTGTDGSITINDAPTGDITIMLKAGVTDDLVPGTYVYDIQLIEAAEVKTLTSGRLNVTSDVTRAIA